ncbi:putative transposase gene of IS630 family insertion sequence ISY100h [Trichodesmium erythraeum IMS101]|uniref:Putative transposase gene of IS630 family insertion sequence ISY100h n=1 Tax=Trichodesmium erythraeum (strain IMS101) TaxID=203124 RepID=Q10YF9_TRIEI|nr:IS630 family transposase [Trichodesmium erythraeum GBRTRLIN201]
MRKDKILSAFPLNFIKKSRSKSFVFINKSGFEDNQDCIYTWSKKGKKVYGEQEEKRGKRENLVAGRRKKEKDLIALIRFK